MAMKTRAHLFVSGRVQGVFFRSRTAEKADDIGVAGWVRNLPDGRAEAVFEGDEAPVEEMVDFCRRGPPGSFVKDVNVQLETYTGEYRDFKIIW